MSDEFGEGGWGAHLREKDERKRKEEYSISENQSCVGLDGTLKEEDIVTGPGGVMMDTTAERKTPLEFRDVWRIQFREKYEDGDGPSDLAISPSLHLIEYWAYDALKKENEELKSARTKCAKTILCRLWCCTIEVLNDRTR